MQGLLQGSERDRLLIHKDCLFLSVQDVGSAAGPGDRPALVYCGRMIRISQTCDARWFVIKASSSNALDQELSAVTAQGTWPSLLETAPLRLEFIC